MNNNYRMIVKSASYYARNHLTPDAYRTISRGGSITVPESGITSLKNIPNGYSIKSGTSMSTPIITGVLSLILTAHPDISPKELKKAVKKSHPPDSLKFDSLLFFQNFDEAVAKYLLYTIYGI